MIPDSYSAWRHCIEVDCGLPLTAAFIHERLEALGDPRDFRTEQFVRHYGAAHLARVQAWFAQAQRELAA